MAYPVILNGDHAEFEREWAGKDPKERPDWPMPSFNAMDWAEAFCKAAEGFGYRDKDGKPIEADWMVTWFAGALMRGYDEHASRTPNQRLEEAVQRGADLPGRG